MFVPTDHQDGEAATFDSSDVIEHRLFVEQLDAQRIARVRLELERNAPPTAATLRPIAELFEETVARCRGDASCLAKDAFCRQLVRSLLEGWFDGDRHLYSLGDRETRITRAMLTPTQGWGDADWPILRAIVRDSWASIATISAWAALMHYQVPAHWTRPKEQRLSSRRASTAAGKRNRPSPKADAAVAWLDREDVPIPSVEKEDALLHRYNAALAARNEQRISKATLNRALAKRADRMASLR